MSHTRYLNGELVWYWDKSRTVRYQHVMKDDEDEITDKIIGLATQYGRYGYRRITAMLKTLGYDINHNRIERIWKENGFKGA